LTSKYTNHYSISGGKKQGPLKSKMDLFFRKLISHRFPLLYSIVLAVPNALTDISTKTVIPQAAPCDQYSSRLIRLHYATCNQTTNVYNQKSSPLSDTYILSERKISELEIQTKGFLVG